MAFAHVLNVETLRVEYEITDKKQPLVNLCLHQLAAFIYAPAL